MLRHEALAVVDRRSSKWAVHRGTEKRLSPFRGPVRSGTRSGHKGWGRVACTPAQECHCNNQQLSRKMFCEWLFEKPMANPFSVLFP